MKSASYYQIVVTILLFMVAVNLLILDLKIFSKKDSQINETQTTLLAPTTEKDTNTSSCPGSCIALINKATEASEIVQPTPIIVKQTVQREFYVPLGSGSTLKGDWDDITTTDTLIDTANYGTIKEAYFIATLRNPIQTGDTQVRLYNVTDKHVVWNTELKMDGPVSLQVTSPKITLDTGAKMYRVQLKSGLQTPVFVDIAKVRILVE